MDVSQSKKFAGKRKLVTRLLFVVYQEHDEGGPAGMNRMQKKNDAQRKKRNEIKRKKERKEQRERTNDSQAAEGTRDEGHERTRLL